MILYVNGDSHSEGHDAIERGPNLTASYGYKLAQKLGAEFVCDATAGCSNEHILKTTKKYLETNTIICCSCCESLPRSGGTRSNEIGS